MKARVQSMRKENYENIKLNDNDDDRGNRTGLR